MRIFSTTSTSFTTQGIGVLSDVISGEVVEEINGLYEVTFEYPITGHMYNELKLRRIVYVKTTPYSTEQPFRIYNISKPINMRVTVSAAHISYDASGIPVPAVKMTSASNGMDVLKKMSIINCPFSLSTTVKKSGTFETTEPKSIRAVLGGEFIENYGGEFEFDHFDIKHSENRGYEKPIYIRYGKNLIDLTQEENCNEVFTGVYPYYAYSDVGDTTTGDDNQQIVITLPEKVVKADGEFDFEKISPLSAGDAFQEPPTEDELRTWAKKWVVDNKIGIPKVQLTVSYTDALGVAEVKLGDTIHVEFDRMGVKAEARCVATRYNIVTGKYNSVDLGETKSSLATSIVDNYENVKQDIANESIKFGAEIDTIKIGFAQIEETVIGKADIDYVVANFAKITNGHIDNAVIGDAAITTAKIENAAITVAKIQEAFIDDLVAEQGKFESAHIGVLTSDNIDADTITAEHIKGEVIEAINLSTEDARINSAKISDLDANKITAGDIDADRLKAEVIEAVNLSAGTIDAKRIDVEALDAELITAERLEAEVIDAINLYAGSAVIGEAKIADLSADKITSGFISADRIKAGSIDADHISADAVNAIEVSANKIIADAIASGEIKVGDANIVDGDISFAKISKVKITNAHMDEAFIADAYIENIVADKIKGGTLDANDMTVTNLRADSITVGKINGQQIQAGELGWGHLDDLLSGDIKNMETDIDQALTDAGLAVEKVEACTRTIVTEFAMNNSRTTPPTSGWSTDSPTWVSGSYIWTRSKTIQNDTDGTVIYSSAVCITGATGAKGDTGLQGLQGPKGDQGIAGANGAKGDKGDTGSTGKTTYFHIKYSSVSNPTSASQMTETPSTYIGTYVDFNAADSSSPSAYTWSRFEGIQGAKGDKGIAGTNGQNGQTSYLHIKYSNDGKTFTTNNGEDVGAYIGQYTDYTESDSMTFSAYKWSKIKGETGATGAKGDTGLQGLQGPKGDQGIAGAKGDKGDTGSTGKTTYFHIKYSSVSNPTSASQMTETPSTYIGTYVDFNAADSSSPSAYTWSRFEGIQGAKGDKGIAGTNGQNGQTSYLHIKYSNDGKTFTTNNGEDVGAYIGQYTDYTESDSMTFSAYKWSKIKGETGATGSTGNGVKSITAEYYLSTSKTAQSGGAWTTTSPTWSSGKYVWTRSKIIYTNSSTPVYTQPLCDSSWEAIHDIDMGSVNLVRNSGNFKNTAFWELRPENLNIGVSSITNLPIMWISNSLQGTGKTAGSVPFTLSPNTEYTLRVRAHVQNEITSGEVHLLVKNSDNTSTDIYYFDTAYTISLPSNTPYTTYHKTFTTGSKACTGFIRIDNNGAKTAGINGSVCIESVMLVKGNKAPEWTPSPLDNNGLEIGGANLLRNGNFAAGMKYISTLDFDSAGTKKEVKIDSGDNGSDWTVPGYNKLSIGAFKNTARFGARMIMEGEANTYYTLSAYISAHRCADVEISVRNAEETHILRHFVQPTTGGKTFAEWTRLEIPFKGTKPPKYVEFNIGRQSADVSHDAFLWVCQAKVEKGVHATAWTPNDLDTRESIETVTSIANGKSTAYYSTSAPSTVGKKENDIWFDTDNGYKMYYLKNGAWYATQFDTDAIAAKAITADKIETRTITAGQIATGTLTANEIAGLTITGDKIAGNTISAGKLTANSVVAGNISSNAVTADKIVAGAINSTKLDTNELFVGDNAFIKKLKAVEIDAASITTGKISSERLDISGLVSYESFNSDIKRVFNVQGNKTYIDGGTIATNTIKADKIDLKSGLTVQRKNGSTTLAVSDEGEVKIDGTLQSANFNADSLVGYKISTDGSAIFNQAKINGEVMLPNAGMTDHGAIKGNNNIAFDGNKGTLGWYWAFQSGTATASEVVVDGIKTCKFVKNNDGKGTYNYIYNNRVHNHMFKANTKYTISIDVWSNFDQNLYFHQRVGDMSLPIISWGAYAIKANAWNRVVLTATSESSLPTINNQVLYISNVRGGTGDTYIFKNLKIEEGSSATPWCPNSSEVHDYTRLWAGAPYVNRESAPFRVTQSGNVYASNVELTGTLHGTVDSGDVQIFGNSMTIHAHNTETQKVSLSGDMVHVNTDFILGLSSKPDLDFDAYNHLITVTDSNLQIMGGANTNFIFDTRSATGTYAGLNMISTCSEGRHVIRHSPSANYEGSLIFTSEGAACVGGDFVFQRKYGSENCMVNINGGLSIKSSIKSANGSMDIRATSTGWAFYPL